MSREPGAAGRGEPPGFGYAAPARQARPGSRCGRLALLHLCVCVLAAAAGRLWFRLGLHFPPCMFNRLTGLCCLTCGATRAVDALLHGQLLRSFLLNPTPVLLCLFLAWVLGFELVGFLRGKAVRFRWGLHALVGIVAVAAVYCVLRNLGLAPVPGELYP